MSYSAGGKSNPERTENESDASSSSWARVPWIGVEAGAGEEPASPVIAQDGAG